MSAKFGTLLLFIAIIYISIPGKAQNLGEDKDKTIEQIIESLSESTLSEDQSPLLLDDLTRYSENPLNINTASAEELERLNLINYGQVQNIIAYRSKYGYILSRYELNAVDGLTPDIIKSLLPFISFEQPEDSDSIKNHKTFQRFILRGKSSLPLARGFSSVAENKPAVYTGPPVGLYSRYFMEIPRLTGSSGRAGRLEVGFITDHDAGEEFFKGSNRWGFDFCSGFISWQGRSFIKQVTLGDYYLMFGQGLSFWSGSGLGKSSNVMNIMKSAQGVRPYTSTDENLFFRGIAAVLGQGPVKVMLFYSNKNRDANLVVDKNTGETQFTSLKTDGYHRTASELEDEKVLNEQDAGVYSELRLEKFRLGFLYAFQHFGLNMIKGTAAYKAKSFEGNENSNLGFDYQFAFQRFQLFGEAGISKNNKPGILQGLIWQAHPRFSLSFYYRYFDPAFHAFYGNPLSEGTEGRNERGFYTALEFHPLPKIKISGYADFYHFPWLTYSTLAPETGRDFLVQLDVAPSDKLSFYLRNKYECKPQKTTADNPVSADFDEKIEKVRLHGEWRITDRLLIRDRVEYTNYAFNGTSENGWLLYQDLDLSPFRKLNLWVRYAWFNTDGYNSRIYTYENDLLYYFAIPEFHGKGQRIYLNLKWQPAEWITAYAKAALTLHNGVVSWGSGNDLTDGNSRTELRAELCLCF